MAKSPCGASSAAGLVTGVTRRDGQGSGAAHSEQPEKMGNRLFIYGKTSLPSPTQILASKDVDESLYRSCKRCLPKRKDQQTRQWIPRGFNNFDEASWLPSEVKEQRELLWAPGRA